MFLVENVLFHGQGDGPDKAQARSPALLLGSHMYVLRVHAGTMCSAVCTAGPPVAEVVRGAF